MLRINKAVTILLHLILVAGASCHRLDRSPLPVTHARNAGQESQVPVLTVKEEQSFNSLTKSRILWFLDWRYPEISCHSDRTTNIATNYQQHVGQQIDLKLVTTRKHVFAYFAQLHFRILFLRDAERGLNSPQLQPFCESTNDDAISWFEKSDEPLLAGEPIYQENKKYTVPPQSEDVIERPEEWSSEKKALYEKLSQAISDSLKKIECRSNQTLRVTIPHFNLTDPEIDFFVSSDSHQTEFLGWAFVSSYPQMEYRIAIADKRFDIVDNPQDKNQSFQQALSKKIKQRKIAEIVINCPEK